MEKIALFIRSTIAGKNLYTDELSYTLDNGALEGVYSDQMTFSNVMNSETKIMFDLHVVANEKIYAVGKDKKRGEVRKDYSTVSLFRYEAAKRKSTGQVTGFMRFVSCGVTAAPAEAMASVVVDMHFEGDQLSWLEKEMLYRDMPNMDGGYQPASFEAKCRFFTEGGKAGYEYNGLCLDVDPDTWERKKSSAVLPKFLAKER
jgi:hypothetical protein